MTRLDEIARQCLLAAFGRIDGHLRELTQAADSQALASPLSPRRADLTPLQQRMLAEGVQQLHASMDDILRRHGVAVSAAPHGAAQDCRAALHHALAAVGELTPRSSDEHVPDDTEAELRRIAAQLLDPLEGMLRALAPRDDPAVAGDGDLDALRRIARAHSLSQFNAPLAELAERVRIQDFMIAVVGRTNAGKSSLINRLLETELLPTAATPATAVPVRVRYGPRPRGLARFADAAPDMFSSGRLAEFAAEHYNAANAKHVESLHFELPARRLAGSVCLVDTPGWSPGAVLPPCDLGVVLIDATGHLSLEETALVDALRHAGAAVLVLLGKADRLSAEDRWKVYGHVADRLWTGASARTRIFFASNTSTDASLRDDWIVRGLEPCLARREALRQASLHRKTLLLREAITRGLERRLAALTAGRTGGMDGTHIGRVRQEGLALIDAARQHVQTPEAEAHRQVAHLLREVAHNAAVLERHSGEALLEIAPLIGASLHARAGAVRQDMVQELRMLATRCGGLLEKARGPAFEWQSQTASAPHLDTSATPLLRELRRPWFAALGAWAVRWSVHRRLRRHPSSAELADVLVEHLSALARWRAAALADLRRAFIAHCDSALAEAERIAADLDSLRRPSPRSSGDGATIESG